MRNEKVIIKPFCSLFLNCSPVLPQNHFRYCDIDEIDCGAASQVKLPNKDSGLPPDDMPPKYCSINDNEEGAEQVQEEGGACGSSALPPHCTGVVFKQFTPEFLSKDTDVSQAYSNNLYGYSK